MTNNELLLGISQLLEPIREDIREIKDDISEIKRDVAETTRRVKRIELLMETNVSPRLQTMEACYTTTYDRYRNSVEDYENMKWDVSVLKSVVMEHSSKIQKIS